MSTTPDFRHLLERDLVRYLIDHCGATEDGARSRVADLVDELDKRGGEE